MSALPSYSMGNDKHGFNKKELKMAYKEEKKILKKEHKHVEKEFHKAMNSVQLEQVSSLAEEEETMATKVRLETFDRPKASRRQRRASLNMELRILTPPQTPKLNLEEVESIPDTAALPVAPLMVNRRAGLTKSLSCTFEAEALAGWKTVVFHEGPIGIKLEATNNNKAARVIGFQDTDGVPSQARANGQIVVDDVIVKVGAKVPTSFDHTLELLQVEGERVVTFRPSFSYELEATKRRGGRKKKSKSKRSLLVEDDEEEEEEPELLPKPRRSKKNSLMVVDDDDDHNQNEDDNANEPSTKRSSHKKSSKKSKKKTEDADEPSSGEEKSTHKSHRKKKTEEVEANEPSSGEEKSSSSSKPSDEAISSKKNAGCQIQIKAFKPSKKKDDNLP